MNNISNDAKLSQSYTAHCIRPTVVTNLFNEGVPVEEICNVTGHKDTKSVKRYIRRVSDTKKAGYAKALNRSFKGGHSSDSHIETNNPTDDGPVNKNRILEDEDTIIRGPTDRRMTIEADGNQNLVRISFH